MAFSFPFKVVMTGITSQEMGVLLHAFSSPPFFAPTQPTPPPRTHTHLAILASHTV